MDKGHLSGDLLCDLAEGQMAPAERREAEAHVEGCADCRRELEALRGYFQDMSSLETLKAPDRFLTKVHARIAKASPWKRLLAILSSPRLMPVPVAAFCLMMVGAFLFYLSRKAQQESPQTVVALSVPVKPSETSAGGEGRVATIPKTVARASSNNQVKTISGRKGKVGAEAGEPTSTGSGSVQADAAAIHAQPGQLALAEPPPSRPEKAFSEEAGKDGSAGLEDGATPKSAPTAPATASPEAVSPTVASRQGPVSWAASKPKAAASPATNSEVSGRMAERDEAIAFAEPGAARGKRESAAPAPPSVTPKPWASIAYVLEWNAGRADAAAFRPGLEALGIRVLRQEQGAADRYELEVPAVKVAKLEEYLRGYGTLVPAPASLPGRKNGAPIQMTLRVTRTP